MKPIWIDLKEMISHTYHDTVPMGKILVVQWNGLMMALLIVLVLVVVANQRVEGFATKPRRRPISITATVHPLSPTIKSRKQNPLDTALTEYVVLSSSSSSSAGAGRPPTLLIVDTNNVRGKSDFALWNCDLLPLLTTLRKQYQPSTEQEQPQSQQQLLHIVYVMDHGCRPQVFDYDDGLIVFAGPHRTADDVIAQATRFFVESTTTTSAVASRSGREEEGHEEEGCQVVVVTSDGELKQRCLRQRGGGRGDDDYKRKKDKSSPIKVVGSPTLVSTLKTLESDKSSIVSKDFLKDLERIESDVRWCTALHPPFSTGAKKTEALAHGPWTSDLFEIVSSHEIFPRSVFSELTWHRVLVAEAMRNLLEVAQTPPSSSSSASSATPMRSSPSEPLNNQHGVLSAYKTFYENHQTDNSSGSGVDTMFLDHRIRRDPYLQQQLLSYFQNTLMSSSRSHTFLKSPSELAVDFMRTLVVESSSSTKTHDEILIRYMNEAPAHLQSSRKLDLSNLLKQLAVREKRDGDMKPKWYLRREEDDVVKDNDNDVVVNSFQPRRGRRSEKRQRLSLSSSSSSTGGGEMEYNLVETGRVVEVEWLQKWKRRLTCDSGPDSTGSHVCK